jgi:hypothetical protein
MEEERRDNCFLAQYRSAMYYLARTNYAVYGEHSDRQRLKDIIYSELGAFFRANDASPSKTEALIDEVVRCALRLDLYIISTQHDVKLDLYDPKTGKAYGFAFDPETMVGRSDALVLPWKENQDEGKHVEIVWKPGYRIYGVANGCNADAARVTHREHLACSEKAIVGCDMYEEADQGCTRKEWLAILRKKRDEWLASQEERAKMASLPSGEVEAEPTKGEEVEPSNEEEVEPSRGKEAESPEGEEAEPLKGEEVEPSKREVKLTKGGSLSRDHSGIEWGSDSDGL